MTDEPQMPMSDRPDPAEPTQPNAIPPAETQSRPPVPPTPPYAPPYTAPTGWSGAPSWGSAPQGWPPPPPVTPPETAAPMGAAPPPTGPPPVGPAGPGWGFGYGTPTWGPPPGPRRPSSWARKLLVGVAIIGLAIASGGIGAALSEAVHSGDNNTATNPTSPGTGNNGNSLDPNGLGNGFPFGNGNNNGNGNNGSSGSNGAPAAITQKVNPAVVDIFTTIDTGSSRGEAAGTGMIITSDGEVLTNNHVIDGATAIRVELVENGQTHTAKVIGYDVVDDVALLKIDDVSNLKTVDTAAASTVQIGDRVVAIGNAGGRGGTPAASSGSVTALDQKVTAGDSGSGDSETLHGMIQISAPIEPGDSGGPLVDSDGRVVGMNTAAAQSDGFFGGSSSTTAFAIPIEKALQIVDQIRAGHNSDTVHVGERAILGVEVRNVPQVGSSAPVTSGAAVVGVRDGSPAADAGLADGDVITSVAGETVRNASDLTAMMFTYHPGDKVDITWVDSNGESHSATLTLVAGPPN
jgi:S1-C subfamily serine protease